MAKLHADFQLVNENVLDRLRPYLPMYVLEFLFLVTFENQKNVEVSSIQDSFAPVRGMALPIVIGISSSPLLSSS